MIALVAAAALAVPAPRALVVWESTTAGAAAEQALAGFARARARGALPDVTLAAGWPKILSERDDAAIERRRAVVALGVCALADAERLGAALARAVLPLKGAGLELACPVLRSEVGSFAEILARLAPASAKGRARPAVCGVAPPTAAGLCLGLWGVDCATAGRVTAAAGVRVQDCDWLLADARAQPVLHVRAGVFELGVCSDGAVAWLLGSVHGAPPRPVDVLCGAHANEIGILHVVGEGVCIELSARSDAGERTVWLRCFAPGPAHDLLTAELPLPGGAYQVVTQNGESIVCASDAQRAMTMRRTGLTPLGWPEECR